MSDIQKPQAVIDEAGRKHINEMHRLGRFGAVLSIIIMIGIPTITGIYFNALPTLGQIISASIGLIALFAPTAVSEVIAYTPILGSSIYLAQITGNIMNLKLPVANAALTLLDVEAGTEDADIVTSIAVSVSSFVTIMVIVLGVLLLIPLQPILTLPQVRFASGFIVQALFGSLILGSFSNHIGGGIVAERRSLGMIVPAIIVAFVNILFTHILKQAMLLSLYQGFLILALIPITWYWVKWLYKTGKINVILPGEGKH